jgi:hypothetical protein
MKTCSETGTGNDHRGNTRGDTRLAAQGDGGKFQSPYGLLPFSPIPLKRGHFYFGNNRTFLNWLDIGNFSLDYPFA